MNICFKILIITIIILCFTSCKKYDEGGLEFRTVSKSLGGNKPGSSKEWHLKKYIVNGIDSTYSINGYSNNESILFEYYKKDVGIFMVIKTKIFVYAGFIAYKTISTGSIPHNYIDSIQCSNQYCQRNIFKPELKKINYSWNIKKLTNKELILESDFTSNHNYRLILKH